MPLNLLDSFGKKGVSYSLLTRGADVIDTDYLSKYFVVSEFSPKFTAGKNGIAVNGSAFLLPQSEILIECLDSAGDNLFIEMARTSDVAARVYAYKESTSFILAVHVFNDTADGIGRLMLYGTLTDGRTVKWVKNITVDKTLNNVSKVRFYQRPQLEVDSILVPVLDTDTSQTLISPKHFTGSLHGFAVDPPRDTNLPATNLRNIDVDYRLVVDVPVITSITGDEDGCNSQMIGSTLDVVIQKIQKPFSTSEIVPTQQSASFIISNVYNNKTIQIADPYFYTDTKNNSVITNIVSSSFDFSYPFVNYITTTASYLTTTVGGNTLVVQQSYADITYRNIRTFSGYLARHKIYKKSLLYNADFQIVSDEPLFINELLSDNITQNKFYERIGVFYNPNHISKYWFTSSTDFSLGHSPDKYINSVFLSSSVYNSLDGTSYMMAKNDSVPNISRNAMYVPYNEAEFLASSGSGYDSNFISLKANVQYILEINAELLKDKYVTDALMEFYFTSSLADAHKETTFTDRHGILLGTIEANQNGTNKVIDKQIFFFTPTNDLYGTLVIVPYRCQAYLKNISFRVYGDDGFSPDVFSTRIPWGVSVANESFEIKSELFDINHNLVYSDLRALKSFDASGSSLIPYIPGGGGFIPGTDDFFVSGSLIVSKSIDVQTGVINLDSGSVYISNMQARTIVPPSRIVAVRGDSGHDGELSFSPIVDVTHDSQSIFLTTNPSLVRTNTALSVTRHAIAVEYGNGAGGRKVYYVGATKTTEAGSGSFE
jgi:hypothetical protein